MKLQCLVLSFILVTATATLFAQTDKEDRQEQQQERKAANKDKVDYNLFRRAIMGTKEFSDERRKVAALQKSSKAHIKIVAVVDSLADNDDPKKLTGYIREDIGDNSTNVYEVIFDRSIKKIISVTATGETTGEEDENATQKKPSKQSAKAKKKTDEDDDDEPEEKPIKKKQKDEDD